MNDPQFDQQLRQQWQSAAAHLPGHIRLQLSPAIAIQRRQSTPARWLSWGTALASLALLVVLLTPLGQPTNPNPAQTSATQPLSTDADINSDDGLLSITPDFYAWLDSDEIRTLAAK